MIQVFIMNINELKTQDPTRFKREYWNWTEHQCAYDEWWEYVEEVFKQDMEPLGVQVDNMYFRLSYSQGDYASFAGWIDVSQWLQDNHPEQLVLIQEFADYGRLKIVDRYDSPRVDFEWWPGNTNPSNIFADLPVDAWTTLVEQAADAFDLEFEINEWLRGKARDLYKALRDEYEYQTSEEMFIEHSECNEVDFDDEGEEE